MAIPVLLPRQGQSVETCLLLSWKKNVGEAVAAGEPLCDVETDKATFAVESPEAGTLLRRYYEEGQDIPVLSVIAAIGTPGEEVGPAESLAASGTPTPPSQSTATAEAAPLPARRRPAASPRARKRAAELGVDLAGLRGSGPGGRVLERDVVQGAQDAPQPAAHRIPAHGAPEPDEPNVVDIPVRGVRKLIADRMLTSLQTTAQLTMHAGADARALRSYRARLKESPEAWDLRGITVTDLVLFAVSRLLPAHPELNAHFLGDRILQFRAVHLGLAVDTPRGLMVPVLRDAGVCTLKTLAAETKRLAAACREMRVQPDELRGATFTVTNLGALGVESFTPVLNPPEVAILGVGGIQLRPVQQDDGVAFVPHLGLSLTINHQAVDGAPGARFLAALVGALASIDLTLAL